MLLLPQLPSFEHYQVLISFDVRKVIYVKIMNFIVADKSMVESFDRLKKEGNQSQTFKRDN